MKVSTNLLTNHDGNRFRLVSEDELGTPGIKVVQLFGAATHVGIVLLNKIPSHLVLGQTTLHVTSRRNIRRRGRLRGLEGGGIGHGRMGGVVGIMIRVLRRESAIHRSSLSFGHCECCMIVYPLISLLKIAKYEKTVD